MRTQGNYIYFDKEDKEITINDINIDKPSYFNKANKNFRLNILTSNIEKYCKKCDSWYSVLIFNSDAKLFDIDSTFYHFYSDKSGFMSSCRSCSSNNESTSLSKNTTTINKSSSPTRPLNINIPKILKKYLNDLAFENDESITTVTIRILKQYMDNNPL